MNVEAKELEVYRSPVGDAYVAVERQGLGGTGTIAALPGVTSPVGAIFG